MSIQPKQIILLLSASGILGLASTNILGANLNLDDIARQIAQQHNANASRVTDEITISSSATSGGKNVIFNYTLAIRPDTPKNKIDQFVSEWKADMVPQTWQGNANSEAFKQGLYYTFIYFDRNRNKITEYSVSRDTCLRR